MGGGRRAGSPASSSSARGWGAAGRLGPGAQLLWRQVSGSRPRPPGSVRDAAPHVWGRHRLQARPGWLSFPREGVGAPSLFPSRCEHLQVAGKGQRLAAHTLAYLRLGAPPGAWLMRAPSPSLPGSAPVPGVAGSLFWGSRGGGAAGRVGRGGETGPLAGREGMERRWPGGGQRQRRQRPTVTGRGLGQLWLRQGWLPVRCRLVGPWWAGACVVPGTGVPLAQQPWGWPWSPCGGVACSAGSGLLSASESPLGGELRPGGHLRGPQPRESSCVLALPCAQESCDRKAAKARGRVRGSGWWGTHSVPSGLTAPPSPAPTISRPRTQRLGTPTAG